ncbi:PLDc N-terminal domain-containing protein [Candidatus Woesearchaeota archaeon]|nr:PLDc N-terminal domain-containing protein [Candidatus Woesearchaeota archaeon]
MLGFFIFMMLLAVVIGALIFAFWIWMIIDCAKRNFKKDTDKVVWMLVIVFLNILGAAIYYFVVKAGDKKEMKEKKK